jgi:hypothetical protein
LFFILIRWAIGHSSKEDNPKLFPSIELPLIIDYRCELDRKKVVEFKGETGAIRYVSPPKPQSSTPEKERLSQKKFLKMPLLLRRGLKIPNYKPG